MYSSYGELCTEVYDLSKPLGFSFGDVEYYKERLLDCSGKVLELGCGSGRVLIPLLQAGLKIDGLDNSIDMLNSCRRRCDELGLHPQLYLGEMNDFALHDKYEAIIIPGGSFQLIEGRKESISTLVNIYHHLQPGGRLILDLFLPADFDTKHVSTRTWETAKNEVITLEEKRIEVDFLEQRIVSLLKYEKWKDGKLLKSELQRFPLCWYGVYEFELLLKDTGFKEIVISADYKFSERPKSAMQMITFEAKK